MQVSHKIQFYEYRKPNVNEPSVPFVGDKRLVPVTNAIKANIQDVRNRNILATKNSAPADSPAPEFKIVLQNTLILPIGATNEILLSDFLTQGMHVKISHRLDGKLLMFRPETKDIWFKITDIIHSDSRGANLVLTVVTRNGN